MKKDLTISLIIIGWVSVLALILAPDTHAQKSDALQGVHKQIIKKKICPMPGVKAEISPTPLKPQSVITRTSKGRITKANPLPSTSNDKHMLANATGSSQHDIPPYHPTGKIDPFLPLIRETAIKKPKDPIFPVTDNPNKTPLEKIDLSQLKLTAVIIPDRGGNRGLVEESSGKGHIVVLNTKIGRHGGKVVDIQKDRLIIEEKGRDEFGRTVTRKKELILPSLIAGK